MNNIEEALNDLLRKNVDAAKGFEKAAEEVSSPTLQSIFKEKAQVRIQFAKTLSSEIAMHGEAPEIEGNLKGDIHRIWMDIRAAISTQEDETIIAECIRGEEGALEEYDSVLEEAELYATTRALILNQKAAVQKTLQKLHDLEGRGAQRTSAAYEPQALPTTMK